MTQVESSKLEAGSAPPAVARKKIPWIAQVLILTNLALMGLVLWAYLQFGSLAAGFAYLRGDRLVPDTYIKSFGSVSSGKDREVVFAVANMSARPVTILGVKASCTCVAADEIPMTIPPGKEVPFRVDVHTEVKTGEVAESLHLFTDYPGQPEVILKVFGRIIAPGPRAGHEGISETR